jgi:hypothetical protein
VVQPHGGFRERWHQDVVRYALIPFAGDRLLNHSVAEFAQLSVHVLGGSVHVDCAGIADDRKLKTAVGLPSRG